MVVTWKISFDRFHCFVLKLETLYAMSGIGIARGVSGFRFGGTWTQLLPLPTRKYFKFHELTLRPNVRIDLLVISFFLTV